MDPTILADVADLEAKVQTLQGAQASVAPLQATADAANTALASGKSTVTSATNDVATSLAKLTADIATIEGGGTLPPPAPPVTPPGGSGGTPVTLGKKK